MNTVTRGSGILEGFLSKKRSEKADSLITQEMRKGKILDIGCGSFPYFLINTDFSEKFGIDPSLKETEIKGINLVKTDITSSKLDFKDNFFDTITMLAVFEHIEKEKLNFVLEQVFRVLKKGGVFIITTPSPWSDKLLHRMAKVGLISEVEIHEHKSHYNMNMIKEIIKNGQFNSSKISSGYFELGFNMWFKIEK